jgi:hypothetical protein
MEALIKFLKSFGLSDQEIKKVLQEVPVDQKGFAGTNITKGIFEKGGKQVSADFPLVTETMVSPFKLDKYKGLSKKEALEKADEALKYLDKELTRTSNLIINQNLQLAPEQKINFSNNLRMKREFEKEVEAFKTQPEAKIIQLETKQPVSKEGIEQLIENAGQVSPPGTLAGDIETRVNRLKAIADKKNMNVGEILKETGEAQLKYAAGNDVGLLRSVARQIMFNDIKSGKLKAPKEIQDIVSGASNIDVIEPFRNIYGENALEQLDSLIPDFKNVATEIDAEKLARSKYEFTPKLDRPKESYTADEMEKILKGEEPPEKKAKGGAIGLDYLTGQEPPKNGYAGGGRIGFEKGSIPEEEDEEPSEEYIKSREAGRFKYSFDVQGPDSRTRKSGLPGRTNPKDYGLGITYLSNPSNETAPEIRVGGSRRGAGIEIRKRFKEGGLGYLVGE